MTNLNQSQSNSPLLFILINLIRDKINIVQNLLSFFYEILHLVVNLRFLSIKIYSTIELIENEIFHWLFVFISERRKL